MTGLRTSRVNVVPPPVGGWNTKDPISEMNPLYAVEMENYFPNNGTVDMRRGYTIHSSSVGSGIVGSLFEYVRSDGSAYLIAVATGGQIWNSTASGTASSINGSAAFTTSEAYHVNFRDRIFMKSYEIAGDIYVWQASGNVASAGFTISGGAASGVWKLTTYKNRLYATDFNGGDIYYGGVDSVSGAMTAFNISSIFTRGGAVWHIAPYSGSYLNPQELFCIISERGEVVLYSGSYPGGADWQLVGRFFVPPPVGRRSFFNWGNDLLVITREGLISLADVTSSSVKGDYTALSDLINSQFSMVTRDLTSNQNQYMGIHYPAGPFILCNVYDDTADEINQYVMNTNTRAWAKFTNQSANSWALVGSTLYFGTDGGKVMKADNGYFDEDRSDPGNPLNRDCKLRCAYNYFGAPATVKAFRNCRAIMKESEGLDVTLRADVDYEDVAGTNATTDTTDTSYKLYRKDIGLTGLGVAASIRLDDTVTTKRRSIQAFQVAWEPGGLR